jgi:hypothetical protein
MNVFKLKNALIFPVNDSGIWDKPSIVGVQSYKKRKDPKEFGLMFMRKYLVDYELRDEYLRKNVPTKISGNYLYLGPLQCHFGHFMEECLGRLWACQQYRKKVDGFIFVQYHKNVVLLSFMIEIFNLLKVDFKKIILIHQFIEVENLIVPEIGSWLGGEKKWFKNWLDKNITVKDYKKNLPSKIVVRRSQKFLGRVAGFDYFSKILLKNGFIEVYPENHTIKEQIEFVVSAKVIVWEQGSACHLLKILPQLNSTAIFIKRGQPAPVIDILMRSKFKHLAIYYNVKSLFTLDKWYANTRRSNHIMATFENPGGLLNFFKKNNLIKNYEFEEALFKKTERSDLIYFFYNYFIFFPLFPFIPSLVRIIKPIFPKFIWARLKFLKHYLAI